MSQTTPASNSRRPRSTRSVAGCLTCRRRKVKCSSRATPCDPCRRLSLACTPSFHGNFKTWTARNVGRDGEAAHQQNQPGPRGYVPSPPIVTGSASKEPLLSNNALVPGDASARLNEPREMDVLDSFNMLDYIFCDLSNEMIPVDFNEQVLPNNFLTSEITAQWPSTTACEPPPERLLTATIDQSWDINSPGDQVMCRVPEWLSTKESIWSCFHYLVNSAQAIPNSPLCHAILAWTYAYLAYSTSSSESAREEHYEAASSAIATLSEVLCGSSASWPSAWRTVNASDQLSLYISCTFFLCQYDLTSDRLDSFRERINKTKIIFQRHWADGTIPGPVESRIIIWLAFLELRFLFLLREPPSADEPLSDLMTILVNSKAISVLRRIRNQRSVLSECFGTGLPPEENEEDLRKDRCRSKFDDIMYYMAKVRRFEVWDTEHENVTGVTAPLLLELREAKVEALQAELGRLQAECELAFPASDMRLGPDEAVDSTMFHTLTVGALRACAVIACNRAIEPRVRTNPASQAAVLEIVRIARILRRTKYLRSPRSTIWPLPLFFAGIETTDEVYQDWILDYMKDLKSWGSHVERSTAIMEQVMAWQEKTGTRARTQDYII